MELSEEINHICALTERAHLVETIREIVEPYYLNRISVQYHGANGLMEDIKQFSFYDELFNKVEEFGSLQVQIKNSNGVDLHKSVRKLTNIIGSVDNNQPLLIISIIDGLDRAANLQSILNFEKMANNLLNGLPVGMYCIYLTDDLSVDDLHSIESTHPYLMVNKVLAKNIDYDITEQLVTLCMFCKRVKNGDGSWERKEGSMIPLRSDEFSHGMCDSCKIKNYL